MRKGTAVILLNVFLLLVGSTWCTNLYGQETDQDRESIKKPGELEKVTFTAGLYGAYAYNQHNTTSSVFNGGAECGAFGDGDGRGFSVGAFFELPILEPLLELYGSVGYASRGGAFGEVVVGGLPILDPNTEQYTTLQRRHTYEATLGYLRTEFGVRLTAPWFPLYIRATASMDFPQSTTFEQNEHIVSPNGVLYPETNTTTREVASGDIQDPESLVTASGSIGYEIPLTERISIAPEISYYYPFNDVTLNREWRITSIQGGAALRWHFGPTVQEAPPPEEPIVLEPSTPPAAPQPPTVALRVTSPEHLSVVKTIVTETFPILPYVFFDSGSAQVPTRYRMLSSDRVESFDEENLSWKSLEAYHDLLNILGSRMADDKSISITINGTTDGREKPTQQELEWLAKERSESIKSYLVEVWNIDPKRIDISTSPRPRFPSSEEYVEGFAENRRVEIRSNSTDVLKPVVHRQFNEYSYNPDQIRMQLQGSSPQGIRSWQLNVEAAGNEVASYGGEGPPPASLGIGLNQQNAEKIATGIQGNGGLRTVLTVKGANDVVATEETVIPTDIATNPFEISRLSLIVFDFDKSEITSQNREMVKSFVADALDPNSTLTIVGSTDRLGEMEHNQQLSLARAESVKTIVATDAPAAQITEVAGVGPKLRYDNSLPEGRYYCRTVTVEVKTPLRK